jgi:hypothetical protein
MGERVCPGLPADWLNAWLAAIGALVLVPELRLHWSDDPVPLAVLTAPGDDDPADLVGAAWPTADDIAVLPIARHLVGHRELPLNPCAEDWTDRVQIARTTPVGWALTSLYTDLAWSGSERRHTIERGQFHTPMPGRDNTMHDRLRKLVATAEAEDLGRALEGSGRRVSNYGLGFDVSRISSLADDSSMMVNPVIEVLAFFGLALFPCRGDGSRRRQRGWSRSSTDAGAFRWWSWGEPLDAAAVDALLDVAATGEVGVRRVGATGSWEVVPFGARGTSDVTRGYGSRRVEQR